MNARTLVLAALTALVLVPAAYVFLADRNLSATIADVEQRVVTRARAAETRWSGAGSTDLPAPVRAYFAFVFPDGVPAHDFVEIDMAGRFRRPLTETFSDITARQVISLRAPDLVFSARVPVFGPVWATAYDIYIGGEMEMAARLLSTVTVMDETSTPALDRTSLRRWLLESPAYPMALLPGGPVTWEPIDDRHARAIVRAHGLVAALVATFDARGALVRFDAEADGDLNTPYHGSGEHTARSDYRLVDGVRIPFSFTIARAAGGETFPFWEGRITDIRFGGR